MIPTTELEIKNEAIARWPDAPLMNRIFSLREGYVIGVMVERARETFTDVRDGLPEVDSYDTARDILCKLKHGEYLVCKYVKVFKPEFTSHAVTRTEEVVKWKYLPQD